jgi:hypothetical protein
MLYERVNTAVGTEKALMETIMTAFDKAFPTVFRGSLSKDLLGLGQDGMEETLSQWIPNKGESNLDPGVYAALSELLNATEPSPSFNGRVQDVDRLVFRGIEFSNVKASKGNAQILFRSSQPGVGDNITMVGQIDSIFLHQRHIPPSTKGIVEHFLVVRKYRDFNAEEASRDWYRKYPRAGAWMCHDSFEDKVWVIKKDDLIAHVATCPMKVAEGRWKVIVSLDRVRSSRYGGPKADLALELNRIRDVAILTLCRKSVQRLMWSVVDPHTLTLFNQHVHKNLPSYF